jgi:hypothetical protein
MGPDPAIDQTTVLSLSLFNDSSVIEKLRTDLGLPICGEDWRVQVGIPPRMWEMYFEYTSADGRDYRIEGKNWKWELNRIGDSANITLCPDVTIEDADKFDIGRILLSGELGEKNLKDFVDTISVGNQSSDGAQPMRALKREFAQLFPKCSYREFFITN